MELIFLKPYLQEKIWGGQKLNTLFKLELPAERIGEAWTISAHPKGESIITYPKEYEGLGLSELYKTRPELFGAKIPENFPLLIKIIDAKEDLSVQVHPNDEYGLKHENELGKTECWYIIDAEPGAKIVYGHRASSKEDFLDKVEKGDWNSLLNYITVEAGEFYYVPAGVIHAIGKGITILETQQNSDITYRLYDYDRKDSQGNKRDLHIDKSSEVTKYPFEEPKINKTVKNYNNSSSITHFITDKYFSVYKWKVKESLEIKLKKDYTLVTVIEGFGSLEIEDKTYDINLADSFIIPYGINEITLKGNMTLIVSNPE